MMSDDIILKHGKVALLEMLAKHIRDRDVSVAICGIVSVFLLAHKLRTDPDIIIAAIHYIMGAREQEEFKQLVTELEVTEYREIAMTYAEQLKQEGMQLGEQKGKQEGMQLGKQEGMHTAQIDIAKNLLKSGVDKAVVASATKLTLEQLKALN